MIGGCRAPQPQEPVNDRYWSTETCRSRLAGERGGSLMKVSADRMHSPASRLLQNYGWMIVGCRTRQPSEPLDDRYLSTQLCRSALARERGGSLVKVSAVRMHSPASRLLQNYGWMIVGCRTRQPSGPVDERYLSTETCRSALARERGGSLMKVLADRMHSPASRLLQRNAANRQKCRGHSRRNR
jgi:hypothetical protein